MDRVTSYKELEVLGRGAEAEIVLAEWFGMEIIVKRRLERGYLHKELDRALRFKRTIREAQMLHKAKTLGVPTPVVYFIDPYAGEIFMQYIKGGRLKELLDEKPELGLRLCNKVGEYLARLHNGNVIHGDPTTSNFILCEGVLVMLDMGLSYTSGSDLDKAIDLHLLKEALGSYHSSVSEEAYEEVLEGYTRLSSNHRVLDELRAVEKRGRYKRVV